jgi:hypothetical protein
MFIAEVRGMDYERQNPKLCAPGIGFKWQGAYGAFTLRKAEVPQVREYIRNQADHHTEETVDIV